VIRPRPHKQRLPVRRREFINIFNKYNY
jgi:hypothetical protein